jgi:O-antigen ligase
VETNYTGLLESGEYPHQNFLGIGAELGLPALILYLGFVVVALACLFRGASARGSDRPTAQRLIVSACLGIFLYQQLRGLLQDTWMIRETYFWLGVGVAVAAAGWRPATVEEQAARVRT